MIAAGYIAKQLVASPAFLRGSNSEFVAALAGCIGAYFTDYLSAWRHNGYWLFDSPEIVRELAAAQQLDLGGMRFFYFELYEREFVSTNRTWRHFTAEPSLPLDVVPPAHARHLGFDIVCYSTGNAPECSPLSCNGLACELPVNKYCLADSIATAKTWLEDGRFANCEPGPYRIVAVHLLPEPGDIDTFA